MHLRLNRQSLILVKTRRPNDQPTRLPIIIREQAIPLTPDLLQANLVAGAGTGRIEVGAQRGLDALVADDEAGHVLAGAVAGPQGLLQEGGRVGVEAARLVLVRLPLRGAGRGVDGGLAGEGAGAQGGVDEVRAPGGGVAGG